jgi:uncharacterized DUF497 family protein
MSESTMVIRCPAASNLKKHGIDFQEAASFFLGDPHAYSDFDEDHSDDDPRFFSIGISAAGKLLHIVQNEGNGVLRIISARHATSRERSLCEES